jgi:uncharacterized protein YjbI with pentapeptide repeats
VFSKPLDSAGLNKLAASQDHSRPIEDFDGGNTLFTDITLQGRHLRWVRFTGSTLRDCDLRGATLDCVIADMARFERCRFDESHLIESVFAGSRFVDCSFNGATADMCNFNGIDARDTDFSEASLRGSRFINSRFTGVMFINCDVRGTFFQFIEQDQVIFKHTNVEEAFF